MTQKMDPDGGEKVMEIDVSCIVPNPRQPRQAFAAEGLEALASSLRQYGLLQPLVVQKKSPGCYELIAGERRLRAAKLCGLKKVPALVKQCTPDTAALAALVENLQRRDLDALEEGQAYAKLMQEFGLTQAETAERVGKSRSHVANLIRLLKLPMEIQDWIRQGKLFMGQARPLLQLPEKKMMLLAAQRIIQRSLSARQAESLCKRLLQEKKKQPQVDQHVEALADQLNISLGTPVEIRFGRDKKKGKIEISFTSEKELERLLALLTEEGEEEGVSSFSSFHL